LKPISTSLIQQDLKIESRCLKRTVNCQFVFNSAHEGPFAVIWLNDGQDITALNWLSTLEKWHEQPQSKSLLLVAIAAGERIHEFGVMYRPDFAGRGSQAAAYTDFLINELRPVVAKKFLISQNPTDHLLVGFSLSGLSAFDIAWHHAGLFGRVGVFSAAFWWRSKALEHGYTEADRIVLQMLKNSTLKPALRFWMQAGTADETNDRNHNGIIDSIDDTLDVINCLKEKGYREKSDIVFHLVEGGTHSQASWAEQIPHLIAWAFKY
jgi:enterochelin esterase-like enzyme